MCTLSIMLSMRNYLNMQYYCDGHVKVSSIDGEMIVNERRQVRSLERYHSTHDMLWLYT